MLHVRHIQYVMSLPPTSRPNWTDAKWTIILIKIQAKERLSSVHSYGIEVYLFVLGFFFTVICLFDWTVKPVNQFSRQVNFGIISNVIFRHISINARVRLQLILNDLNVIVKKKKRKIHRRQSKFFFNLICLAKITYPQLSAQDQWIRPWGHASPTRSRWRRCWTSRLSPLPSCR